MAELDLKAQLCALLPVVQGGFAVIPAGLWAMIAGRSAPGPQPDADLQAAAGARAIVLKTERRPGFEPVDPEADKVGYDIEGRDPRSGGKGAPEVQAGDVGECSRGDPGWLNPLLAGLGFPQSIRPAAGSAVLPDHSNTKSTT